METLTREQLDNLTGHDILSNKELCNRLAQEIEAGNEDVFKTYPNKVIYWGYIWSHRRWNHKVPANMFYGLAIAEDIWQG